MTIEEINNRIGKLIAKDDKNIEKLLLSYERELGKSYKAALAEIKNRIALMYEKYGDSVTYSDMVSYNRLTNLELEIAYQINELKKTNIKTTASALKDIYSQRYYGSAYAFETSIGTRLGFGQLNPDVVKAALINPLDRIKWSDRMKANADNYTAQIRSSLSQGLLKGDGYSKIAKDVTDKTSIDAVKALRIIRTEGHRVQNAASLIATDKAKSAVEDLGIEMTKVWVATLDGRTRDDHRHMDGQEADENGLFHFPSGGTTEGPGLSGIAEEDINCRCTTITKLKGVQL